MSAGDVASIIRAIAELLWPIFALLVVALFRKEIREILHRVRRGKLLGQELELEAEVQRLDIVSKSAGDAVAFTEKAVVKVLPALERGSEDGDANASEVGSQDVLREILNLAASSPTVGLIRLSSEIEREVRRLSASVGGARRGSTPNAIEHLGSQGLLPQQVVVAVRNFWSVRNKIVHGEDAEAPVVLRTIDSGLVILRALKATPHEVNVVQHPGIAVYSDAAATTARADILAVVLETTSAGGLIKSLRVFPTTRTDYVKGQRVSWDWNLDAVVGESWYRDPDTDEVKYAWTESGEFVGHPIGGGI